MATQVLYRTMYASNAKLRPPWFSRAACLRSLRDALETSGAEYSVTFVADGGLPDELRDLVGPDERIEGITAGTAASSLRATMDLAVELARRHPEDFFWIAEDDYLYDRAAFRMLLAALEAEPGFDYLSLFTARPTDWAETHPSQPMRHVPALPGGQRNIDGTVWHRSSCTTSTFGCNARVLLADARLIVLGTRVGAPFDGPTWYALAGMPPFSWRHLFDDIDPYLNHRGVAKIVGKPLMRTVLNVAARRFAAAPRVLGLPVDNLAVHCEAFEVEGDDRWESRSRAMEPDAG